MQLFVFLDTEQAYGTARSTLYIVTCIKFSNGCWRICKFKQRI